MPGGLMVQFTLVLFVLITVAENCFVWPAIRFALVGATLTETGGINVTTAGEDLVVSAWLVAVIVTFCCAVMLAGAVYSPFAVIVPVPEGVTVQITDALAVLRTVAVNGCC